jgi:hypothetical protein
MTSIGAFVKQIPLNDGYFRPVPSLAAAGTNVSSYMYTYNNGTLGYFAPNATNWPLLSSGQMLLKDMGMNLTFSSAPAALATYYNGAQYNTPLSLRRVQLVDYTGTLALGPTDGVTGNATGVDSDYNVAYIQLGLKGNALPGPFVRTG